MKIVQIRIVYHSSILIEDEVAVNWDSMSNKERCDVMWAANQDPETQFSAGNIDMNDPTEIEFVGDPDDFDPAE